MTLSSSYYLLIVLLAAACSPTTALQFRNPFARNLPKISVATSQVISPIPSKKKAVLEAVSFTGNGKTATPEQQQTVLRVVRELETLAPPSPQLLTDPVEAKLLNGTWYLQYTSPSTVGDTDQFPDAWKPESTDEEQRMLQVGSKFRAKGSVSAAGIKVETSNRVVKQIFNVAEKRVVNEIALDFGLVKVAGGIRQSSQVATRAVVAFDTCEITIDSVGITLNLSFLFKILGIVRQTRELGWLETTFVDEEVRIGRGNKGTMFVLTRDPDAVKS